jgi:uncharacterized protein (DUF1015 family)
MIEIAPFAALLRRQPDAPPTRDAEPAIYRHVQTWERDGKRHTRRGFIARVRLHDVDAGEILPCEASPAPTVAAALARMREARAQLDPPLALYNDGQQRIDAHFEPLEAERPHLETTSPDGTTHRIWRLTDEKTMARIGDIIAVDRLYLADGDERYRAMLAWRDELAAAPGGLPDDAAPRFGVMRLSNHSDPGLVGVGIHRVLVGARIDREDLLQRAREFFTVSEGPFAGPAPTRAALAGQAKRGATLAVVTPGATRTAYLRLRGDLIRSSVPALGDSRAVSDLVATLIDPLVLGVLLGVDAADPKRVHHTDDWDAAFAALDKPETSALFLANPTTIEQLKAVLDEGRVCPARAVHFPPHLPSGLIACPVAPDERVRLPSLD